MNLRKILSILWPFKLHITYKEEYSINGQKVNDPAQQERMRKTFEETFKQFKHDSFR